MTISTPAIPYGLARSWLLAPAVDDERLRAAHNSDADVVIIDIEDGVPERNKEQARLMTRRWLEDVSTLQPVHRRGAVRRPARLRDR